MTVAFMASSHFVRFNPEYFTHPLTHPTEEWHANPQYPASQSANKPLPTSSVTRNSYPAVTLLSTICGAISCFSPFFFFSPAHIAFWFAIDKPNSL